MNTYICYPTRTAIGSFQGSLANVPAPELAAHLIKSILTNSKLDPAKLDEVILGSVLTAAQGQAPARQALIKGGIPNTVQAMTINKVCSSGLKAVMLASTQIASGNAEAIIAGGMENMSLVPYYLSTLRSGARLGHSQAEDGIIKDGLWDVYNNFHMGNAAEICAREFRMSREDQDAFAISSYNKALDAIQKGYFKGEITPFTVRKGREEITFDTDEEPGKGNVQKIPSLKPVFDKEGTVTAANASSINDGACLMLVCSEAFLKANNLTPMARVIAQGWNAQAPEWFTTAPVGAIVNAAGKARIAIKDIDLFEINEAFSSVALACQKGLEVPSEKLNITGGAVALGHPIGASGARILTTLIHNLHRTSTKYGVAGICNGGGEATALIVERT